MQRVLTEHVSVILPSFNEAENLPKILCECVSVLSNITTQYEIIVVDDCSTDNSQEVLLSLKETNPCLQIIQNKYNLGCHPSTLVGLKAASGNVLIILPADGQISPTIVPSFLSKIHEYDLVCSYRHKRADSFLRKFVSRLYNTVLRLFFSISLHDTHSPIAVKREVVTAVVNEVRSSSAFVGCEFILRALMKGFRVTEIQIDHLPRITGKAKGANLRDAIFTPLNFLKFLLEVKFVSSPLKLQRGNLEGK